MGTDRAQAGIGIGGWDKIYGLGGTIIVNAAVAIQRKVKELPTYPGQIGGIVGGMIVLLLFLLLRLAFPAAGSR